MRDATIKLSQHYTNFACTDPARVEEEMNYSGNIGYPADVGSYTIIRKVCSHERQYRAHKRT
jgi:hypothetical protein